MKVFVTPLQLQEKNDWNFARVIREAGHEICYAGGDWDSSEAFVIERLAAADGILASSDSYTRRALEACPNLKIIARSGVGYDSVDLEAAADLGIMVATTPGQNHDAVADMAISMVMAMARHLIPLHESTSAGNWIRQVCPGPRSSVLGVIGLGRIGRTMALRANAFGFKVLACESMPDRVFAENNQVELVPLEELLRRADYVSLHVPLTPETEDLINRDTLARMKSTACLVNTARGGLVEEDALYDALKTGKIRAAYLDVFKAEPPVGSPLLTLPNVFCSPHMGGIDKEAVEGMAQMAAESIVQVLAGELPELGIINAEVWPKVARKAPG